MNSRKNIGTACNENSRCENFELNNKFQIEMNDDGEEQ